MFDYIQMLNLVSRQKNRFLGFATYLGISLVTLHASGYGMKINYSVILVTFLLRNLVFWL